MPCIYCENIGEHCLCPKCFSCKESTNGSQVHRHCMKDYMDDREVAKLMAGPEECLPTEEQEEEAESLRRDTPLSMEDEENIFHEMYRFEMVKTDIDCVFATLQSAYPDEDFGITCLERIDIHRYLSDEVFKKEFFMANNQWGTDFANYEKNKPIRMRKGIITKFDRSDHKVYHPKCVKNVCIENGYTKGLVTVEASNVDQFFTCIIDNPNAFFCGVCQYFMFEDIQYYNDNQFAIPDSDDWPGCNYLMMGYGDDINYVTIMAHIIIADISICSGEPPRKKVCRRLNFDE